jgi:hypothetical protein
MLRAQQVDQLQNGLAPGAGSQVALLFVQGRRDEDLLAVGVSTARRVAVQGARAQLVVVGGAHRVAREEDARDQHQQDEEVRDGEDGPVDEAQDGALAAARCNIVGVDGAAGEVAGDAQRRGRPRQPGLSRVVQLGVVLGSLIERIAREQLIVGRRAAVLGRHCSGGVAGRRRRGEGALGSCGRPCIRRAWLHGAALVSGLVRELETASQGLCLPARDPAPLCTLLPRSP